MFYAFAPAKRNDESRLETSHWGTHLNSCLLIYVTLLTIVQSHNKMRGIQTATKQKTPATDVKKMSIEASGYGLKMRKVVDQARNQVLANIQGSVLMNLRHI